MVTFDVVDSGAQDLTACMENVFTLSRAELAKGGRVLIHCAQGISRSASCVLYCLMKFDVIQGGGMTLKQAFQHTKSIRRIVLPNPNFMTQLFTLEMALYGVTSGHVEKHGNIKWRDSASTVDVKDTS